MTGGSAAARDLVGFLDQVRELFERGWGEHHPLVPEGKMAPTGVMVYGARDEGEIDVVMKLIEESYKFARGG